MKTLVLLAALAVAGFLAYRRLQRPAAQAVIKAPEKYAKSLAEDEKRAADAAAKANAAINQQTQAVDAAVQEGEKK